MHNPFVIKCLTGVGLISRNDQSTWRCNDQLRWKFKLVKLKGRDQLRRLQWFPAKALFSICVSTDSNQRHSFQSNVQRLSECSCSQPILGEQPKLYWARLCLWQRLQLLKLSDYTTNSECIRCLRWLGCTRPINADQLLDRGQTFGTSWSDKSTSQINAKKQHSYAIKQKSHRFTFLATASNYACL